MELDSGSPPVLERTIGLPQATAMVAGIIVGASIFVQPAEINCHVPTVAGVLSVWAVAGTLTLFGAMACAELSSVFPQTGGVYVFLRETLSPASGFLWVWAMFWIMHSGIIAASAGIFARYMGVFVPLNDAAIRAAAIAIVILLSWLNYRGVRQGSTFQTVVTAAKFLAIAVLLSMVFWHRTTLPPTSGGPAQPPVSFRGFVLAVGAGLFAFGGWHMVTYTAGETRRPEKTIPRALMIGVVLVTACYIALNAAYLHLLPLDKVVASTRVAADAAGVLAGPRGSAFVSGLVILSSLGVLNGVILAGPRIYYAIARESMVFRALGRLHPRFRTPHVAIMIQAAWTSILILTGTYRVLFTRVVYTEWLFFALMTVGLLRMRLRREYAPRWKAWGYPVAPVLFIGVSITVAMIQMAADPAQAAWGMLLVAAGLPVYYFSLRGKRANH